MMGKNIFTSAITFFAFVNLLCFSLPTFSQDCSKSTIYFGLNKRKTEKIFLAHIDSILDTFEPSTSYLFEVHGHADSRGNEDDNFELAAERIDFVMRYVRSKKLSNIYLLQQNYGERNPISSKHRENRRVNIYTAPINDNGTIEISGSDNNKVNVPSNYFRQCGYCTAQPELKTTTDSSEKNSYKIQIESNCDDPLECFSVEFRFPYEQFNTPSKIKVPRRLYMKGCGGTTDFSKDSLVLDSTYYRQFKVRYDTVTDEYVVTHDCFTLDCFRICCGGSRGRCIPFRLHYPDSILNRKSTYFYRYKKAPSYKILYDSLSLLGDTNYFERCLINRSQSYFYGIGWLNNEVLFLNIKANEIARKAIFDENNLFSHYEHFIYASDYQPLEYLQSSILVKTARKINESSVGFYLEPFDYFIPLGSLKKNRYQHLILDFPYTFGIKINDTIVPVQYSIPKKKYKKRKRVLKVKIRRNHIK